MKVDKFHFVKILTKKKRKSSFWFVEKNFLKKYKNFVAIDEVGRGALGGPLTLAGLFLDKKSLKTILKNKIVFFDSKELTPQQRLKFQQIIKKFDLKYKIISLSNKKIDKNGIIKTFIEGINKIKEYFQPQVLIIDGLKIQNLNNQTTKTYFFVKGDKKLCSLGAASILAKVHRDQYMIKISKKFPHYRFDTHKGYGTKEHLELIKKFGPCKIHRKSFLKFIK